MSTAPHLVIPRTQVELHAPYLLQVVEPHAASTAAECHELAECLIEVYGVTGDEADELASAYLGEPA